MMRPILVTLLMLSIFVQTGTRARTLEQGVEAQTFTTIELGDLQTEKGDAFAVCDVDPPIPPLLYYPGFILGEEWYFTFQDPIAAGCTPSYPFGVTSVEFAFCTQGPCTTSFSIQFYEANLSIPSCPIPSYAMGSSGPMQLEFPAADCYYVSITLPDTLCVFNPYFVAINLYDPVSCLAIIFDQHAASCRDYICYDTEFDDLSDYGFPGKMYLCTRGISSSEVDCTTPPPNVQLSYPDDGTCFGNSVEIRAVDWNNSPSVYQVEFQYNDGRGWTTFAYDDDGTSCYGYAFVDSLPCEDGWSATLDASALTPGEYQFRVIFHDEIHGDFMDEIMLYHPEYSYEIEIIFPPASNDILFGCRGGCLLQVQSDNEVLPPSEPVVEISCEVGIYERGVPELDQLDVLRAHNFPYADPQNPNGPRQRGNDGCTPTSFTSCFEWLADQDDSYKCLIQRRDGNGDPIPNQYLTDEELAESLWLAFGTEESTQNDPFGQGTGTDYARVRQALRAWIERKCGTNQFIVQELKPPDANIDRYIEELKKENEDVVLGCYGHTVTANSYSIVAGYTPGTYTKTIDVMDPALGPDNNPVWLPWPPAPVNYPGHPDLGPVANMWVVSPTEDGKSRDSKQLKLVDQFRSDGKYVFEYFIDSSMLHPDSITIVTVTMEDAYGCMDKEVVIVGEFTGCVAGDADGSGGIDIDDVVYLISYIFAGGFPPNPADCCGDADGSGGVDIDDVIYLINFIFSGGPPPVYGC